MNRYGDTGLKRPIRVGFLTPEYPSESYCGGIGVYVEQIASSLIARGHFAHVILCSGSDEFGHTTEGVPVHRLVYRKTKGAVLARISIAIAAARLARELRLDLIEAPDFGGLSAFLRLFCPPRCRVVVRLHTGSKICRLTDAKTNASLLRHFRNRVAEWLEKQAISSADYVTSVSRANRDMSCDVVGVKRADICVTPNPISPHFFESPDGQQSPESNIILFAGRLQWLKGPDLLVRAIPRILETYPDSRFYFAGGDTATAPGESSMLAYLRSLIPSEACGSVTFTGFLRPRQLRSLYRTASVCVFPSRWEGFGLVAAEAMACGKSIVVSSAPGFREFVSHNVNALVAGEDDPTRIAEAVVTLLSDTALRHRIEQAARETALTQFSPSVVGRRIEELYCSMCPTSR